MIELTTPISEEQIRGLKVGDEVGISGVVFTDFGSIEDEVTMDDFRLTLGAGLRVTIAAMGPVPIAVDWGIPVIKQDFDDERLFSFYIGINR